jgi:transaldolase
VMERLAAVGIDMDDVVQVLEDEGVAKFDKSWQEVAGTVQHALDEARR